MPNDIRFAVALVWLTGMLAVGVGYAIVQLQRSDYDWWESCLYFPTYLLGRLLWRVHFTNDPPKELAQGAVLVANHRTSVDPLFVQLAARRRVHWMVAKEYCQHPIFGPFLRAVQVIPTNRSGMDTAATRRAMQIAAEGRLVGMFPEGRINHTSQPLVSIRSGAALIALRTGVPLIPLYIDGAPYFRTVWSPLLMSAHVAITFGTPVYPPKKETSDDVDPLYQAERLILECAQQIVALEGVPNFQVELAAKRKRRKKTRKNGRSNAPNSIASDSNSAPQASASS